MAVKFKHMKIYPIEAGNFKHDGGAMFGVVPKTLWNRTNPADEDNLIDIAARCLLIEDGKKLGATKTPSYYVNGKPLQEFGLQNLKDLIQSEMDK